MHQLWNHEPFHKYAKYQPMNLTDALFYKQLQVSLAYFPLFETSQTTRMEYNLDQIWSSE